MNDQYLDGDTPPRPRANVTGSGENWNMPLWTDPEEWWDGFMSRFELMDKDTGNRAYETIRKLRMEARFQYLATLAAIKATAGAAEHADPLCANLAAGKVEGFARETVMWARCFEVLSRAFTALFEQDLKERKDHE